MTATNNFRKAVLQNFKKLHRTRLKVFEGDKKALNASRIKINEEYKKNKHVTNEESIHTMIKFSADVEKELRTQVIQAVQVKPHVYEAKIRDDTVKLDNIPYNDTAVPESGFPEKQTCSQNQAQNKKKCN